MKTNTILSTRPRTSLPRPEYSGRGKENNNRATQKN